MMRIFRRRRRRTWQRTTGDRTSPLSYETETMSSQSLVKRRRMMNGPHWMLWILIFNVAGIFAGVVIGLFIVRTFSL